MPMPNWLQERALLSPTHSVQTGPDSGGLGLAESPAKKMNFQSPESGGMVTGLTGLWNVPGTGQDWRANRIPED